MGAESVSDYTATRPASLPDYPAATRGTLKRRPILTTAFQRCPTCGRSTYIVTTDDRREPYDRLGCFWTSCGYVQ